MPEPGIAKDACRMCLWPKNEHSIPAERCPDYGSNCSITGWLETVYEPRRLILTESVMTHMLVDLDQIVTEHEMDPTQFTDEQWWQKLRHCAEGEDYKR